LKLSIEIDGQAWTLELGNNGSTSEYHLHGVRESSGTASIERAGPNVYSVLLEDCSYTVHLANAGDGFEVWVDGQRHFVSVRDARDDSKQANAAAVAGRTELRTQMPGKIVKILAPLHTKVVAGQGLIVVEAMKMQNEIKSPKDGLISKVCVAEGATVGAGETLMVVE
jgi:biotin carboxyl carrier protein